MRTYTYGDVQDADSILFVRTVTDSIRGRHYNTHYYKYLYEDDSDNLVWKAAVIMIEQDQPGPTHPRFEVLSQKDILDQKEEGEQQFEEIRRALIAANRDNRGDGRGRRSNYY